MAGEISKEDFQVCKSISIDNSFLQPRIVMYRDVNEKQLIHKFECVNDEAAESLFRQLLEAWKDSRK